MLMPLVFNDPAYWLERAITALQVADKMTDVDGQARMIALAARCQLLAKQAMIPKAEAPRERPAIAADLVLKRAISPRIAPE